MGLGSTILGGLGLGARSVDDAMYVAQQARRQRFYEEQAALEEQIRQEEQAALEAERANLSSSYADIYQQGLGNEMPLGMAGPPAPVTGDDPRMQQFGAWHPDVQEMVAKASFGDQHRQSIERDRQTQRYAKAMGLEQFALDKNITGNAKRRLFLDNDLPEFAPPEELGYDVAEFQAGMEANDPDMALGSYTDPAGAPAWLQSAAFKAPGAGKTPIPPEAQALILQGMRENSAEKVAEGMMMVGQMPTANTLQQGLQGKDPQYANFLKWQADGLRQEAVAAARALAAFEASVSGALTKNAPRIEELRKAAEKAIEAANVAETAYAEYVQGGSAPPPALTDDAAFDQAVKELGPNATREQVEERMLQLLGGGGVP